MENYSRCKCAVLNRWMGVVKCDTQSLLCRSLQSHQEETCAQFSEICDNLLRGRWGGDCLLG